MYLYEIGLNDPEPIHATKEWLKNNQGYCHKCESIISNMFPEPIDVSIKHDPKDRFYSWIWFTGISIYHIDFIAQIKPYLNNFVFGKCFDSAGDLIKNYVTCYTDKTIFVRGSKNNVFICDKCGCIKGSRSEPYYILDYCLYDSYIFQNSVTRMYLTEEVVNSIDMARWPDFDIEKISIVDTPLDGVHLPCDPPHIIEKFPTCDYKLSEETIKIIQNDYYSRKWKEFKG